VPLGQGEPPIPCASAKRALGQRLHLCRDMARLCVCGLRHQCLCTADCWLARQPHRQCTLRVGCVGTGHLSTHASSRPTGASPGSQYLSIKYTERLAEAKIAPPVGSVGGAHMTTPWLKRSTACSMSRSFIGAAHGAALKRSNMPPSNG